MNIIFYGGKQAGMISLLTLLSMGERVICVIPVDSIVSKIAHRLKLNTIKVKDINDPRVVEYLKSLDPDLIVCCNGTQIFKKDLLELKGINLHANLYKYKGNNPIERMLKDGETKASVGVHVMTEKVDNGPVLAENFKRVSGKTEKEVYNELYPLYVLSLIQAIK